MCCPLDRTRTLLLIICYGDHVRRRVFFVQYHLDPYAFIFFHGLFLRVIVSTSRNELYISWSRTFDVVHARGLDSNVTVSDSDTYSKIVDSVSFARESHQIIIGLRFVRGPTDDLKSSSKYWIDYFFRLIHCCISVSDLICQKKSRKFLR